MVDISDSEDLLNRYYPNMMEVKLWLLILQQKKEYD